MASDQPISEQVPKDIADMLAQVYRPEGVTIWLRAQQDVFGGKSALDLIASGDGDTVRQRLHQLLDGAYA